VSFKSFYLFYFFTIRLFTPGKKWLIDIYWTQCTYKYKYNLALLHSKFSNINY
jgi:hypothetical protein